MEKIAQLFPPAPPDPPAPAPVERRTYSVAEAAGVLGISTAMGYKLVREGKLEHLKLGARVVIPRRVIARMLGEE